MISVSRVVGNRGLPFFNVLSECEYVWLELENAVKVKEKTWQEALCLSPDF